MTRSTPRRICTALTLTALLVLPGTAVAAGRGGGMAEGGRRHHGPAYNTDARHHRPSYSTDQRRSGQRGRGQTQRPANLQGVVVALGGVSAPTTLTLRAGSAVTLTVTVGVSTTIVRRYDGRSSLDELSPGDYLQLWGRYETGSSTVFDARRVKDVSIQRAYTRVVGTISQVTSGGASLNVGRGLDKRTPYVHGDLVQLSYAPNALVVSGSITMTAAAVQPGAYVLALGVYDRHSHTLRADRIRILPARQRRRAPAYVVIPSATTVPASSPTVTATATLTGTATPTLTATAVTSPTATQAATNTVTATATLTATDTVTSTVAPSATATTQP